MKSYTTAKWYLGTHDHADFTIWANAGTDNIGTINKQANAARIVACVNACSDMADQAVEIAALRAQNAELCKALQFVLDDANSTIDYETQIVSRAALAKGERS